MVDRYLLTFWGFLNVSAPPFSSQAPRSCVSKTIFSSSFTRFEFGKQFSGCRLDKNRPQSARWFGLSNRVPSRSKPRLPYGGQFLPFRHPPIYLLVCVLTEPFGRPRITCDFAQSPANEVAHMTVQLGGTLTHPPPSTRRGSGGQAKAANSEQLTLFPGDYSCRCWEKGSGRGMISSRSST